MQEKKCILKDKCKNIWFYQFLISTFEPLFHIFLYSFLKKAFTIGSLSVDKTACLTNLAPSRTIFWGFTTTHLKLPKMQWLLCELNSFLYKVNNLRIDTIILKLVYSWVFIKWNGTPVLLKISLSRGASIFFTRLEMINIL